MPVTPCGNRIRRGWSIQEKRNIVNEVGVTGTLSEVSRRHGINIDYIYRWRRTLCVNNPDIKIIVNNRPVTVEPALAKLLLKLFA